MRTCTSPTTSLPHFCEHPSLRLLLGLILMLIEWPYRTRRRYSLSESPSTLRGCRQYFCQGPLRAPAASSAQTQAPVSSACQTVECHSHRSGSRRRVSCKAGLDCLGTDGTRQHGLLRSISCSVPGAVVFRFVLCLRNLEHHCPSHSGQYKFQQRRS